MSARVAAIALALTLTFLIFGSGVARASDGECTFVTRKAVVADLTHEGVEGLAKSIGTGLLFIAAREGPAPLRIGSAILFGVEALGLANTTANAAQMPLLGDPNQILRVCHSEGPFVSALGFRALTVVSIDPHAADRFQAKIHQEFDTPSAIPHMPEPSTTPDVSSRAQAGQNAHATWDDKAIEDALMKLRSARKPTFGALTNKAQFGRLPPPALPARPLDFLASTPPITVTGEVVDDATDGAVNQGFVYISTASVTAGLWQTVMIGSHGAFSLDLPPGTYVASVSVPGYVPARRIFTLTAGERARDVEVRLPRRSAYPCSFVVVNNTGWAIKLFMGMTRGPIEMVGPWSHRQFTVNRAFNIGPQAEFSKAAPLDWPPVPADCEGPGIAYLNP
ncbi:MAG: carboxypeptidase-like regulatory domain-containing protein [Acidobacteriaceae bacterium]